MLRRSVVVAARAAAAVSASGPEKSPKASPSKQSDQRRRRPLLGYPIRRAAAEEMLYGGVRVTNLNQAPFPLKFTLSEDLPPPSLDRERHDLQLEMQLPRDGQMGYNNVSMNIQRQLDYGGGVDEEEMAEGGATDPYAKSSSRPPRTGFRAGEYFGNVLHAERHHNSSLPYAAYDTNNVLGLRLFPLNMHARHRVEGVRVRTEDLLHRMRDFQTCAAHGLPLQSPLPLHTRAALEERARAAKTDTTLYSGSIDHRTLFASGSAERDGAEPKAAAGAATVCEEQRRRLHLRGGPSHPRPRELSILTRPQDLAGEGNTDGSLAPAIHTAHWDGDQAGGDCSREKNHSSGNTRAAALQYFYHASMTAAAPGAAPSTPMSYRTSSISARHPQYWAPLQMLKPMGHAWSASVRSSGARGPSMQLMQERLDQKGFGWKRKSRSLWQQDIATAGFRPHRYF